ncbi:MAG: hypothetical protein JWO50_200 [Candidatus Kaiserbacteria bacterium]|nr:hypothetical protein [Candidatus Kaiserbacteria bacterium]
MTNFIQSSRIAFIVAAFTVVTSVMPVIANAQFDEGCCGDVSDYSGSYSGGYDSSYSPSYGGSYSPSYDSSYSPQYDSSYSPSYDSSYSPFYDSSYSPSYDSSYSPFYDSSYSPSYDSSYSPQYDSAYSPSYDSSYSPQYDSAYSPSYDSAYSPSYDSSYTASYDSSYSPSYDSSYSPSYDSSYSPSYGSSYSSGYGSSQGYSSQGYSIAQGSSVQYAPSYPSTPSRPSTPSYPTYPGTPSYPSYPTYPQQPIPTCVQQGMIGTYPHCSYPPQPVPTCAQQGLTGVYPNCRGNTYPQPIVYTSYPGYSYQNSNSYNPVVINNNNNNNNVVTPIYSQPVQYINNQAFACYISATRTSVRSGDSTVLAWAATGANYASLSGVGNVNTTGTLTVHPYSSTNYVLTITSSNGQTSNCSVNINVGNNVAAISLSQIPYTGFDFGVLGNSIYWFALGLFAVSGAYLIVYMNGGAARLATQAIKGYKPVKPVNFVAKAITTPVQPVVAPTVVATPVAVTQKGDSMTMETVGGVPRLVINRS